MEPFRELPKDIPEEKLTALIDELGDQSRKIGLYMQGSGLHGEQPNPHQPQGPEEYKPEEYKLVASFAIGDIAFSTRVQDPAQETVDDTFRSIKLKDFEETQKRLREQYEGKQDGREEEATDTDGSPS